jgi:glyoxylase-like metal-dependent hydrolase (beta-lactamase superfamily II)
MLSFVDQASVVVPRRLSAISGAPRRLDGGVLFGNTPRRIWAQWVQPDYDNQVELASRALLVQEPGRNILIMAGSDSLLAPLPRNCRCQPQAHSILHSLARLGLGENDIHVVFLTHLHAWPSPELTDVIADGLVQRVLFPKALYLTGAEHWRRARHPHPYDRKLFIPWVLRQLDFSGRLKLVGAGPSAELGAGWYLHQSDGYTPGQLLPELRMPGGPLLFAGDLIPSVHWLDLPVTSGLDRNPENLIGEKERILDHLVQNRGRLFMARDQDIAVMKVLRDRQSRYSPYDKVSVLSREEV